MKLLLDTTALVDVSRSRHGRRQLLAELVHAGHTLSTTALNIAEVCSGMRPGEEPAIEAFLSGLECHAITPAGGRLAGKLKNAWSKKGHTPTLANMLVAAVAIKRRCRLVTDNRKDSTMPEEVLCPLP
jgi:predicted nucleic acid-binding protein